jgi:5-methylcytosine-specific restriction enzyme B
MSIPLLLEIVHSLKRESWSERNKAAVEGLFGAPAGRYPKQASKVVTLRAPEMSSDSGVPFAAYIHPNNPPSGRYSGLSFVIFPVPDQPTLIGMVVGTEGLTPDEAILGRPGHARKTHAICSWLNKTYGRGHFIAWAKQDPTRTDLSVPESVQKAWAAYKSIFDRYGKEMYALYCPTEDRAGTEAALTAFLDLLFEERGYEPMANSKASYESIQAAWFEPHAGRRAERRSGSACLQALRHHPGSTRYWKDDDGNRTPPRDIWWARADYTVPPIHHL